MSKHGDFMCENAEGCGKAATHQVNHPQFKRPSLMCETHAIEFVRQMERMGWQAATIIAKKAMPA